MMKLSIAKKIGLAVASVLVATLGAMLIVLLTRSENLEMRKDEENIHNINDLLIKSLTFSMAEGVTDIKPFIEKTRDLGNVSDLRVIPSNRIRENSESQLDDSESQVLRSRQQLSFSETFNGEPVVRVISPILGDAGCAQCHESEIGEPLAIVSVRGSMAETMASIRSQRWFAFLMSVGAIVVTFLLIMFMIDRQILQILRKLIACIKGFSRGDVTHPIEVHRSDEIGQAADALRHLQGSLQAKAGAAQEIANGNLSVEIPVASEVDTLGQSMIAMKERLSGILNETSRLIKASQEGKLNTRGDASQFEGCWREQINELNKLIEAFVIPIRVTADHIDRVSRGDIPPHIADGHEWQGEFSEIKHSLNHCVDVMNGVLRNAFHLLEAARSGRLNERVQVASYEGAWQKMLSGINGIFEVVVAPIQESSSVLKRMANGDLTHHVAGVYEGDYALVKDSLNQTLVTFNRMLGQMSESSHQLAASSGQISQASQTLSQGATEQASSLEEISSSMAETSSRTRRNAENAKKANQLAASAHSAADQGNQHMGQMLTAMNEINQASHNISKIIKLIDEIAFQTNLLALNAAVEAARAGVHGKGFAVVAEEVRNLAQRTARAANETTELIEQSVKKVVNGADIANNTAKALKEIVATVSQVTEHVGEIASSSNEQAQGIEQMTQALSQIDRVTQSNTANAEESAAAAQELSSHAEELKHMVSRFHIKQQENRKPLDLDRVNVVDHEFLEIVI
jgi:methyl-accepting chemotaxis protein